MRRNINIIIGLIFIIPGFFILLDLFNIFRIRDYVDFTYLIKNFWVILLFIIPGIFIHLIYFLSEKTSPVLLFAGSVLVTSGAIMHLSYRFDIWQKLWPLYLLSVAIAVLEIYLFNGKERAMLILAVVLAGISGTVSMKVYYGNYYWDYILGMVLISLGLIVIFVKNTKSEQKKRSM